MINSRAIRSLVNNLIIDVYGHRGIPISTKQAAVAEDVINKARPYWDEPGRGWNHAEQVLRDAKRLAGRDLTDNELATIVFHDAGVQEFGRANHGYNSAQVFQRHAKELGYRSPEARQIAHAIERHMRDSRQRNNLRNPLLKLLVEADEGAPVIGDARLQKPIQKWVNGEVYNGISIDSDISDQVAHIRKILAKKRADRERGIGPFTERYRQTFAKEIEEQNAWLDSLTDEHIAEVIRAKKRSVGLPV